MRKTISIGFAVRSSRRAIRFSVCPTQEAPGAAGDFFLAGGGGLPNNHTSRRWSLALSLREKSDLPSRRSLCMWDKEDVLLDSSFFLRFQRLPASASQVLLSLALSCFSEPGQLLKTDHVLSIDDNQLSFCSGHTAVNIGKSKVIVFGGIIDKRFLNDIFMYDIGRLSTSWSLFLFRRSIKAGPFIDLFS